MILLMFGTLIIVPIIIVFLILSINKKNREKKKNNYHGHTMGTIIEIKDKGLDHPWVITVSYKVNNIVYEIKETAKLEIETVKVGKVPIGQRKTFVLGNVKEGDYIDILYDINHPERAIIMNNDGFITG